jgi:hypothetical protein
MGICTAVYRIWSYVDCAWSNGIPSVGALRKFGPRRWANKTLTTVQWRYFLVLCLLVLEIYVATRPYHPPFLTNFINPILTVATRYPPLLPFQLLILARNMIFTFFMALSQLGPHLQRNLPPPPSNEIQPGKIALLEQVAKSNEAEASRLLQFDLAPYIHDAPAIKELRTGIRKWLVQNRVQSEGQVQEAVAQALNSRRQPS